MWASGDIRPKSGTAVRIQYSEKCESKKKKKFLHRRGSVFLLLGYKTGNQGSMKKIVTLYYYLWSVVIFIVLDGPHGLPPGATPGTRIALSIIAWHVYDTSDIYICGSYMSVF